MRYKNNTPEFRENLAEFREMEEVIPMTSIERSLFLISCHSCLSVALTK